MFSITASRRDRKQKAFLEAAEACIALLCEQFPQCFRILEYRRRPLKIGIHHDILAKLGGAITPPELAHALRWYCGNGGYLRNTLKGAWRIDLDGKPSGAVTAEEEASAKSRLAARSKTNANIKPPPAPKRLTLADLKAAALARREGATAS
jgi:ProP effector